MFAWGRKGRGPGTFLWPQSVTVNATQVLVTDSGNQRVQVFHPNGDFVHMYMGGRHELEFGRPVGLAMDAEGTLYCSDADRDQIHVVARTRAPLVFGAWGSFPGLLAEPQGLVVEGARLWIADTRNHRLQSVAFDGSKPRCYSRWQDLELRDPVDLALAPSREFLVVTETLHDRVHFLDWTTEANSDWEPAPVATPVEFGSHFAVLGGSLVIHDRQRESLAVLHRDDGAWLASRTWAPVEPIVKASAILLESGLLLAEATSWSPTAATRACSSTAVRCSQTHRCTTALRRGSCGQLISGNGCRASCALGCAGGLLRLQSQSVLAACTMCWIKPTAWYSCLMPTSATARSLGFKTGSRMRACKGPPTWVWWPAQEQLIVADPAAGALVGFSADGGAGLHWDGSTIQELQQPSALTLVPGKGLAVVDRAARRVLLLAAGAGVQTPLEGDESSLALRNPTDVQLAADGQHLLVLDPALQAIVPLPLGAKAPALAPWQAQGCTETPGRPLGHHRPAHRAGGMADSGKWNRPLCGALANRVRGPPSAHGLQRAHPGR